MHGPMNVKCYQVYITTTFTGSPSSTSIPTPLYPVQILCLEPSKYHELFTQQYNITSQKMWIWKTRIQTYDTLYHQVYYSRTVV